MYRLTTRIPCVEPGQPSRGTDLVIGRTGGVDECLRVLGSALGGEPPSKLLLRPGVVADRAEGFQLSDARAHLGLGEVGIVAAGGGHESAQSVPLGADGG